MLPPPTAGAVLYAANAVRLGAFYAALGGFDVLHADDKYTHLRLASFDLVVMTTEESRAAGALLTQPPARRNDAAFKPVFYVTDLAAARARVSALGGRLNPSSNEWRFDDFTVCDGLDIEGNLFQLRQPAGRSE